MIQVYCEIVQNFYIISHKTINSTQLFDQHS